MRFFQRNDALGSQFINVRRGTLGSHGVSDVAAFQIRQETN